MLEALVGAALVLLSLVAQNSSIARAIVLGFHLINTYLLLGSLSLTVLALQNPDQDSYLPRPKALWVMLFFGWALVGALGAVTALGDTLFPAQSLSEGLRSDLDPLSHFLVRLRVIHPVLACAMSMVTFYLGWVFQEGESSRPRSAKFVLAILIAQILVGLLNVALLAPVTLQMVHLLLADTLWIALIFWSASCVTRQQHVSPMTHVKQITPV